MIRQGGIFGGKSALGMTGLGETSTDCTSSNHSLVKQMQTYLKNTGGCSTLHVDGDWQGCSASAYRNVFGLQGVTADAIRTMTGQTCKSANTMLGTGYILDFQTQFALGCNDATDGCTKGGITQCGANQCLSTSAAGAGGGMCVPDPLGVICGGKSNSGPPPPAGTCSPGSQMVFGVCVPMPIPVPGSGGGGCPAGQINFGGQCITNVFQPNPSGGASSTTCPEGSFGVPPLCAPNNTPGGQAPSDCSSGWKIPGINTCIGGGGLTKPDACPAGSIQDPLTKTCWPNPLGGGGTTPAGGCPTGQMNVPLLGCVGNPLGGGNTSPTIPGVPSPGSSGCPAGTYGLFPPLCFGIPGAAAPSTATTPTVTDQITNAFGSYGVYIVGALALGAAAVAYVIHKKHQKEAGEFGFGTDELGDLGSGFGTGDLGPEFGDDFGDFFGDTGFEGELMMNARRRKHHRKAKKSHKKAKRTRRVRRHCRRNCSL